MAEAGEIDPYISHALPLAQAVEAMRLLENREVIGKAVVTMNGYSRVNTYRHLDSLLYFPPEL
ncbi:MAG: hypothetical protein CM15mP120_13680 [Pseudomonadota bacterium]|nr:MAG: hypothetical protein CM15mP120_13680 [Pseudomonadota bacterium]